VSPELTIGFFKWVGSPHPLQKKWGGGFYLKKKFRAARELKLENQAFCALSLTTGFVKSSCSNIWKSFRSGSESLL